MASKAITPAVSAVSNSLLDPLKRHIGYAFELEDKIETFSTAITSLQMEKNSVQHSVLIARERGETVHDIVLQWQTRVETAIVYGEKLIRKGERVKSCCSLNFKARYQIGKKLVRKTPVMLSYVADKAKFANSVSFRPKLDQVVKTDVEGYEAEARTMVQKEVMVALLDPSVLLVGLYGMGGIGKTTLAKEIHLQATREKYFDKVVIVEVTATPQISKIQGEIAIYVFGHKLEEDDVLLRAIQLKQQLIKTLSENRILVILDDLWGKINLDEVGIPDSCKILMTSRREDVLHQMGSNKNFDLKVLSLQDSMRLFERVVRTVNHHQEIVEEIPSVGKAIVAKCSGFPLMIVTVAGILREKFSNLDAWEDVLTQMCKLDNLEIQEKVYSVLELSYDRLDCEDSKLVFLLYGIHHIFSSPRVLLWNCLAFGMFKNYTPMEARRRLKNLITKLKFSSLLEDDISGKESMHDVVRDVAIKIASKKFNSFPTGHFNVCRKWPGGDNIGGSTHVCGISNIEIREVPNGFEVPDDLGCPDLQLLTIILLGLPPVHIPYSTFQGTRRLKVVNFNGLRIASVPGSLYALESLHTLCLHDCTSLSLATSIGQLANLEILSLCGSDLESLPSEVGQLIRLKTLDLNNCSELSFIPANVISKLTSLEELLMQKSFKNWDIEEHTLGSTARISELNCLYKLTSLAIDFHDATALQDCLIKMRLERYAIKIGRQAMTRYDVHTDETHNSMRVDFSTGIGLLEKCRGLLLESHFVHLHEINGVTDLSDSLGNKVMSLVIHGSSTLQQVVDRGTAVCIPALMVLMLVDLKSLVEICQPGASFRKLKRLHIHGCPKFKSLFSAKNLPQIEAIWISECKEIEALFVEESSEVMVLPLLCSLYLKDLPRLKWFIDLSSSSTTSETNTFFSEKVAFPNLQEFFFVNNDNVEMIWCSASFARSSSNLETVVVGKCKTLTEIVSSNGREVGCEVALKQLKGLNLSGLPCLKSFSSGNDTFRFPLLDHMAITGCPKLKTFSKNYPSAPILKAVQITENGHFFMRGKYQPQRTTLSEGWISPRSTTPCVVGLNAYGQQEDLDLRLCEGGLNSTIEKLFAEMNPSSSIDDEEEDVWYDADMTILEEDDAMDEID